jgi:multidrug efflux system membrane fusion protein
VRAVTVAQQDDVHAVIASGIGDGERVITTGFSQLTDGAKIAIGVEEDLQRPAGSERRRGPPSPSARSRPQAEIKPPAPEPSREAAERRTPSGRTTTATP